MHCVGEQTKQIVKRLPRLKTEENIPVPANGKAAFSHAIRNRGSEYIRATIYLMC